VSVTRAKRITAHVAQVPKAERDRLAKQKRGILDCGFVDMKSGRCGIYEVRPTVCRLFGSTEGMQCPKVDRLVQIVPASTASILCDLEHGSGNAYLSTTFRWN
jgi:Fe-S-cluster containining protein